MTDGGRNLNGLILAALETHTKIRKTRIDFSTTGTYALQVCTPTSKLEVAIKVDSGAFLGSHSGSSSPGNFG